MTFKASMQNDLRMASDYDLQSITNGTGRITAPGLAASLNDNPISNREINQMAEDELYFRHNQYDPALFDDLDLDLD